MKKTLFGFAVLSAAVACADVSTVSKTVFGILRVDSKAVNTIVSVPWVATGAGDSEISVADIIKTANLTAGDRLYKLDGSGNKAAAWELAEEGGILVWNGVTVVAKSGDSAKTGAAADATAGRGTALLLERQNPTEDGQAKPFYLNGQVAASKATSVTAVRSSDAVSYSLFAPPTDAEANVIATSVDGAQAGDQIIVRTKAGANKLYTYKDAVWQTVSYNPSTGMFGETPVDAINVPAGLGFWYVCSAGTGDATITWPTEKVPGTGN